MSTFLAKLRVIITAAPTWLAGLAAAIPLLLTVWVPVLPEAIALRVTVIAGGATLVIGAVIQTIRILTPAPPNQRGLLPPDPPQPPH